MNDLNNIARCFTNPNPNPNPNLNLNLNPNPIELLWSFVESNVRALIDLMRNSSIVRSIL